MKYYKLQDLCTDIIDCPHSTPEWKAEGIRVVRNFNLKNGNLDFTDGYFVDEETYRNRIKRAVPEPDDIIISREAPMGVVGIVPKNLKCCLGQRLVLLKVDKSKCNPYYLLFMLMSDFVQTQFKRADATGSIVSNLCIPDLKEIVIPMVDEGQENIANLLKSINNKMLINNKINDNLLNQLKTIYDYWFIQFDFPDENGNPYRSSGGKMVWNEKLKRVIPNEWSCQNIRKLTSITWGQCPDGKNILSKSATEKDLIDYCSGAGDMKGGFLVDCQAKTDNSKRFAHENNILVSVAGKIGDMCVVDHLISLGRAAMAFSVNNHNELTYIYMTLQTLNKKMTTISTGSIQKVINNDHIDEFNFPYNEQIVSNFGELTLNIFDELKQISNENKELTKLRDWLLPMLMNGQATIED